MNGYKLLKTIDLENIYNVSRESIRLWREKGMPAYYYGPKTIRYDFKQVDNWLRDQANSRSKRYEEV